MDEIDRKIERCSFMMLDTIRRVLNWIDAHMADLRKNGYIISLTSAAVGVELHKDFIAKNYKDRKDYRLGQLWDDFENKFDIFSATEKGEYLIKIENYKAFRGKIAEALKKQPVGMKRYLDADKGKMQKVKIERIAMALDGKTLLVAVNDDYSKPLFPSITTKSWGFLYKLVRRDFLSDADNKDHKGYIDYFNSNENNQLYKKTGAMLTKILKVENHYVAPAIKMEVISLKAFRQRHKRQIP